MAKEKTRGAKDDFESLKALLDDNPSLKNRVMHMLRQRKSILAASGKLQAIEQRILETHTKKPQKDKESS